MKARFFRFTVVAGIAGMAMAATPSGSVEDARAAFESHHWSEVEAKFFRIWNQIPTSVYAEEAGVFLADVYLREEKLGKADTVMRRFQREFPASSQLPRIGYYQALLELKRGDNSRAAILLIRVLSQTTTQSLHDAATLALTQLVEGQGLSPPELDAACSALQVSKPLQSGERTVLLMAPYSGEFAEVGKSLREGVSLAFEEAKSKGQNPPNLKILDDQGNLVQGVHQLRKILQEESIDAILGPAMSDVAAGVAIELSARKSPIPVITPTATTYGIASLGEGVFQLNVTTHVLGKRIAEYAVDCLGLREFVIAAPHSEYGFQLAEAFTETVLQKGGMVVASMYVDPDASDLTEPLQELRQKVAQYFFDKMKKSGMPGPEGRLKRTYLSDSTFSVDGIFIPVSGGDDADKLASQIVFNKIRGQLLGSSGWYDKAVLLKNSAATQGAYFSVDFEEHPRTGIYSAFSAAYTSRWKRPPDRVAALSYDAARFLLQGMEKSSRPGTLIPALHAIENFPGVLGDINFGKEGVNQNTSLFRLERKSFREVQDCAVGR